MRVRLTIEYDNDQGDAMTLEEEKDQWVRGHIEFLDLWVMEGKDQSIKIKFEEIEE